MVGGTLLAALAALAGSQPAAGSGVRTCDLVAPNGDAVGFQIFDAEGEPGLAALVAMEGAVWPPRTLVARRVGENGGAFALGDSEGLVLRLGESHDGNRPAVLHRRAGDRIGLPLAFGSCRPKPPTADIPPFAGEPLAIGDDIAAFDPESWPADRCALVAPDGRRMPLSYELSENDFLRLRAPGLWGERRVTATLRRGAGSRSGSSVSAFRGDDGLHGTETFFIERNPNRAVKLIAIEDAGGEAAGQAAFAICGYSRIERRRSIR